MRKHHFASISYFLNYCPKTLTNSVLLLHSKYLVYFRVVEGDPLRIFPSRWFWWWKKCPLVVLVTYWVFRKIDFFAFLSYNFRKFSKFSKNFEKLKNNFFGKLIFVNKKFGKNYWKRFFFVKKIWKNFFPKKLFFQKKFPTFFENFGNFLKFVA